MRRLFVIDDDSSSVQAAVRDVLIAKSALITSPERANQHTIPPKSTLVCPVATIGTETWLSPSFIARFVYGDVCSMERAFLIGADDFLCEPWTATELLVRIARTIRGIGDDLGNVIEINGATIVVSSIQASLWRALVQRAGTVVDRRLLSRLIEGDTAAGRGGRPDSRRSSEYSSRAVDMQIARLRRALGESGELIETVRGRGYRLNGKRYKNSNLIVDK